MKTLAILLVCAFAATASADDIYGGIAMETAPLAKARYEHPVGSLTIPIELSVPVIRPNGGDGEVRAGVRRPFRLSDRWRIDATLLGFVRTTDNDAFRAGDVGLDAEAVPTVRLGRATLGLELGIDQSLGTYISNNAISRAVYMDVKDGWYRDSQTTFRFGVRAAYPIGAGELRLRAGAANELIPFFAELGFVVHL
jgi:hypothetical protein